MERTITLFDSITSSILNEELSIQEGIIRYIEFLQGVKDDQKSQILGLKNLQKLQKNVGYRANRLKNVLEQMENFEGLFKRDFNFRKRDFFRFLFLHWGTAIRPSLFPTQ